MGEVLSQDRGDLSHEGSTATQHLIERDPEGIDVGARIGRLTGGLLGTQVPSRAQQRSDLRMRGRFGVLREPEIRELGSGRFARREKDVDGRRWSRRGDPPGGWP